MFGQVIEEANLIIAKMELAKNLLLQAKMEETTSGMIEKQTEGLDKLTEALLIAQEWKKKLPGA